MKDMSRENKWWPYFEKRHVVLQYKSGVSVAKLASLHGRSKVSIRKMLISQGAVDPVPGEFLSHSRLPFDIKFQELNFGLDDVQHVDFPRDRIAWSDSEIALLAESYLDGFSI